MIHCSVIIINAVNPKTARGWKVDFDEEDCPNTTQFIKCVERFAYMAEEIIISGNFDQFTMTDFYTDTWNGIAQSVEIGDNVITTNWDSTLDWIELNSSISYFVYIMDKRFQFVTANPIIVPRSKLTLKQAAGSVSVYLQAIRHEKLNLPHKPCEPSLDYEFATCLEKSVVASIGCQPTWRQFSMNEEPLCDSWNLLSPYGDKIESLANMDRSELFEATKCVMPCTFMEYKESVKFTKYKL